VLGILFHCVGYSVSLCWVFCFIVLGILFHCVVLCIVCVYMCTVPLLPGVYPIAVDKYINDIKDMCQVD
jgi:hypothetical protein